jgi:hypothetical protein
MRKRFAMTDSIGKSKQKKRETTLERIVRGVQTNFPKEPNYIGAKNSSLQNEYKNLGPRYQIWFRHHGLDNPRPPYEYTVLLYITLKSETADQEKRRPRKFGIRVFQSYTQFG